MEKLNLQLSTTDAISLAALILSLILAFRDFKRSFVRLRIADAHFVLFSSGICVLDFILVNSTHDSLSIIGVDLLIDGSAVPAFTRPAELYHSVRSASGVVDESSRRRVISTEFPLLLSPCESRRIIARFDHDQIAHLQESLHPGHQDRSPAALSLAAKRLLVHTSKKPVVLHCQCDSPGYIDWCKENRSPF